MTTIPAGSDTQLLAITIEREAALRALRRVTSSAERMIVALTDGTELNSADLAIFSQNLGPSLLAAGHYEALFAEGVDPTEVDEATALAAYIADPLHGRQDPDLVTVDQLNPGDLIIGAEGVWVEVLSINIYKRRNYAWIHTAGDSLVQPLDAEYIRRPARDVADKPAGSAS